MSVKCGYSSKYYPLIMKEYLKDTSTTKEEFKKFVESFFLDPNSVYRLFDSGVDPNSTQTPVFEVQQISSRNGVKVKTDSELAQEYYVVEDKQYNKMKDDFVKKIISLSVFDLSTETFVNPNQLVGDSSLLNKGIFEYKKSLLRTIAQYLNKTLDDLDSISIEYLNYTFNSTISEFESIINNPIDHDANYYEAYNAFVILKTFDNLLDKLTPFVKVNPEYKKSSQYSKQRYVYVGPNVQLDTG